MAILKKGKKQNFTVVDNNIFKNKELALKDIGLLCFLLSLPENWEFSENGLLKILKKDGQTSVRTALKNLENQKYLFRKQNRNEKGHIVGVEWVVFDEPQLENQSLDIASLEFQPQVNTKEVNTKEEKKNNNISFENSKEKKPISFEDFEYEPTPNSIDYNADKNIKAETFWNRLKKGDPTYIGGIEIGYFFNALYEKYPKRVSKKESAYAFLKCVKTNTKQNIIDLVINVDTYIKYCFDNGTEPQYIKHFQGFINDTQYNEYPKYNCDVLIGKHYYETKDDYTNAIISGEIEMYNLPRAYITI